MQQGECNLLGFYNVFVFLLRYFESQNKSFGESFLMFQEETTASLHVKGIQYNCPRGEMVLYYLLILTQCLTEVTQRLCETTDLAVVVPSTVTQSILKMCSVSVFLTSRS